MNTPCNHRLYTTYEVHQDPYSTPSGAVCQSIKVKCSGCKYTIAIKPIVLREPTVPQFTPFTPWSMRPIP